MPCSRSSKAILYAAILCSVALLTGCGTKNADRTMTFNMGDGTLTTDGSGGSVYKDADGSSASVDGDGPVLLPTGIDVFPGAKVSTHMVLDVSPERKSYVVAASTSESINRVLDHYRTLAKAQGFTIEKDEMDSDSSTVTAQKGDTGFTVLVKPDVPNTDFQLMAHGPAK